MPFESQLAGLNRFFATAFDESTSLASMLDELGFDANQRLSLDEKHLPAITAGIIEAIRKKLTLGGNDLWFRVLRRRLGLDGEPPASMEETARGLQVDTGSASQAEADALQKLHTKTAQQELRKELRRLALAQLAASGEKPAKENVLKKLERLADLRAAADVARIEYESRRLDVMKKVQEELDAVDAEFKPALEAAEANASTLEAEIKNDVLLRGESLRGSTYQAIYTRGRVSWDAAAMNEYSRDHPEVLPFRKEGQPSVSIRSGAKASPPEGEQAG
jgi:hypothetical protein